MSKQFWIFLLAGVAIVGGMIFTMLTATTGAHLRLEGKILKVRVLQVSGGDASFVMVDFRAANPSDVPLVVGSATLRLRPAQGDPVDGIPLAKADIAAEFKYEKLLGSKYNEVLTVQDRIAPHQSVDRMVGARFDLSEAAINARRDLRLVIEDVDGTVAELPEAH
jgi:hypothetical protein